VNISNKLATDILNLLPLIEAEQQFLQKFQDSPYYRIRSISPHSSDLSLKFLASDFIDYNALMKILSTLIYI
jgi:hypothetical protein